MRRVIVFLVWAAALAMVVLALGLRVRAKRLADPVQTLAEYLTDVPPDIARFGSVIQRNADSVQVQLRADARWVRTFAARNRFTPVDGSLIGLAADRWMLLETKRKGAVAHLMLPSDGQPALLTFAH